jgi:hypothetical protein
LFYTVQDNNLEIKESFYFCRSDDETMLLQFLQDSESQWPRRSRPTRHTTPSSAGNVITIIHTGHWKASFLTLMIRHNRVVKKLFIYQGLVL